jgi:hypothetical protein
MIELKAADLAAALKAVVSFAAPESEHLPALTAVHVQREGNAVLFSATDRYTLGRYRVELHDATDTSGLDILIPVDAAKAIIKMASQRGASFVILDQDDSTLKVNNLESRSEFRAVEASFPRIDILLTTAVTHALADTDEAKHPARYTPRLLARFEKAADRGDYVTIWPAPKWKPNLVTVGDSFVGLIMPVKGETSCPSWVAALDPASIDRLESVPA